MESGALTTMVIKWKGYPVKKGTRATTAVQSSKSTLKAINDIYILEEEAPKPEVDKPSGFTKDVVDMVTSGKLIIPDTAQYYLNKYQKRQLKGVYYFLNHQNTKVNIKNTRLCI